MRTRETLLVYFFFSLPSALVAFLLCLWFWGIAAGTLAALVVEAFTVFSMCLTAGAASDEEEL